MDKPLRTQDYWLINVKKMNVPYPNGHVQTLVPLGIGIFLQNFSTDLKQKMIDTVPSPTWE